MKRPLDMPEDIEALLPPEWGGKPAKPEKAKAKTKQKGKLSLTAQYLQPDTVQHSSHNFMQNRPAQLSQDRVTAAKDSSIAQQQQQPHTRPNAAAAVAAAHRRFEAQQTQHTQQAQHAQHNSSAAPPWLQSTSNTAAAQSQGIGIQGVPMQPAHSFGSWLRPPWDPHPTPPHPQALGLAAAPDRGRLSQESALPLPSRALGRNEERLGQLAAMHHQPTLASQAGTVRSNTSDPSSSSNTLGPRGVPHSRSPSPVLMEDDEFDADLSAMTRYNKMHVGLCTALQHLIFQQLTANYSTSQYSMLHCGFAP